MTIFPRTRPLPSLRRRTLLAGVALTMFDIGVRAQTTSTLFKPVRPVRIVSPQQAGGSTDSILRPLAQRLSELWGQPVIVDNRPGGGSVIATQIVAQSAPDGHTLGLAINSLTINPTLRNDLPYDTLTQLTPIIQIGTATVAFVAHPSVFASSGGNTADARHDTGAANTLPEFIAVAKARPGKIAWASLGIGTGGHITGELLRKRAGIDIVHVPYSGSSGAYRDLLPGRVQAAFVVLESAVPHIKAGNLKLLAVADPRRNRRFPTVATLDENYPGLGYDGIFGLIGPGGLPADTQQAIYSDVARLLAEPAIRGQLEQQSMDVLASPPAVFAATIRREIEHWRRAVQESGAQLG